MQIPIYADVLFFINCSMDFLALYLAARLLHREIHTGRLLAAAALGALYAILTLYLSVGNFAVMLANIAASAVLVLVGLFPHRRWRDYLSGIAVFYGVSFLLGGAMTALYNLVNSFLFSDKVHAFGNFLDVEAELSFGGFFLLAAASAGISFFFGRLFVRSRARQTARVELELASRRVRISLLVDSGNLLCDPIGGKPVLVVSFAAVEPILYAELRAFFANPVPDRIALLSRDGARRVRVIPAEGGLYFAFRPDAVLVNGTAVSALVAVDTAGRTFGGTDGVLPSVLSVTQKRGKRT